MHRILVIDDDSSVRVALRAALEYSGFRVEEAENGEEGLWKARENIPDLILCDFEMPVMDGLETVVQLRKDPVLGQVPVIVISGRMSQESERRVLSAGANAVLPKPFSFADLSNLIRRYLTTGEAGPIH